MSQYTFPLAHTPLYTEENFCISACNETAWNQLNRWPHWPSHALVLAGSSGSGKSHISHLWAQKTGAAIMAASELTIGEPQHHNWLVEDLETLKEPRALLHLFNHIKENRGSLLITTNLPPAQLIIPLADLSSRLVATPLAIIESADDTVLAAAMRNQFANRQLKVEEDVITYLLPRIERSLSQIQTLVRRIDETALEQHKNITVPFVRKLLET